MRHSLITTSLLLFSLTLLADDTLKLPDINSKSAASVDKIVFTQIESKYPNLHKRLEKIREIKKERGDNSVKDVIFLFTSESVPVDVMENFLIEASVLKMEFGVEAYMVLQGIAHKGYAEKLLVLKDKLSEYDDGNYFIENSNTIFDPKIFKALKIKKVPAIALATYTSDSYPTDSDIKYLIRGDRTLGYFIDQFKKDNERYEEYFNSISALY